MKDVNFCDYESAERFWQSRPRMDFRKVKSEYDHGVDAKSFINELFDLWGHTGDYRFMQAIEAIHDHQLEIGGRWSGKVKCEASSSIMERNREQLTAIITDRRRKGFSQRVAFATAAALLRYPGNSFSAAVKSIERIWQDVKPLDALDNALPLDVK